MWWDSFQVLAVSIFSLRHRGHKHQSAPDHSAGAHQGNPTLNLLCALIPLTINRLHSDLACVRSPQYSVPVVKYDRNGFRPRLRQLIFTLEAAYLVEEAKIKQRIDYSSLKGKRQGGRSQRCSDKWVDTFETSSCWLKIKVLRVTLFSRRCVRQQPEWQLPDPACWLWWHQTEGRAGTDQNTGGNLEIKRSTQFQSVMVCFLLIFFLQVNSTAMIKNHFLWCGSHLLAARRFSCIVKLLRGFATDFLAKALNTTLIF